MTIVWVLHNDFNKSHSINWNFQAAPKEFVNSNDDQLIIMGERDK